MARGVLSLPPPANGRTEAQQAKNSFAQATAILSESLPHAPALRFATEAADVRRLANKLAGALEAGATLAEIDARAVALGAKCLEVQRLTLRARATGHR